MSGGCLDGVCGCLTVSGSYLGVSGRCLGEYRCHINHKQLNRSRYTKLLSFLPVTSCSQIGAKWQFHTFDWSWGFFWSQVADFCSKWLVLVHYKGLGGWHCQILIWPIYQYTLTICGRIFAWKKVDQDLSSLQHSQPQPKTHRPTHLVWTSLWFLWLCELRWKVFVLPRRENCLEFVSSSQCWSPLLSAHVDNRQCIAMSVNDHHHWFKRKDTWTKVTSTLGPLFLLDWSECNLWMIWVKSFSMNRWTVGRVKFSCVNFLRLTSRLLSWSQTVTDRHEAPNDLLDV